MAWLKEHLLDRAKLGQAALYALLLWIYIFGFEIQFPVVVGAYAFVLFSLWAIGQDVRQGPEEFIGPVE